MWTSRDFGADYFERGVEACCSLYTRYRWMPERTIPFAARLCEELPIPRGARVLDFGCARGFLVKALRLLGRDAWGVDLSEWAIANAPRDVAAFVTQVPPAQPPDGDYDVVIAKDVLEHMEGWHVKWTLRSLALAGKRLFAAVPLGADGAYVVPAYERDVTHIIRESLDWWCARATDAGWSVTFAGHEFAETKDHWVKAYPKGNGFFVAERTP